MCDGPEGQQPCPRHDRPQQDCGDPHDDYVVNPPTQSAREHTDWMITKAVARGLTATDLIDMAVDIIDSVGSAVDCGTLNRAIREASVVAIMRHCPERDSSEVH